MLDKTVIIVGGGFGGVRVALDLAQKHIPHLKIILISDKPHFEYHAALYRVVAGRSPLEVCVPLREIFARKKVEVIQDTINEVKLNDKKLRGASGAHYRFDFLVLALGSETAYFDIPGLSELSFGFKSIQEALRLKRHLHQIFTACENAVLEEKVCAAHLVVVGGGTSGTELAGELIVYARELIKKHKLDPALVTVDLIEAAPRLLPALSEDMAKRVTARLHDLGVNVFLNRKVVKEEIETLYLKDMEMKLKTVVWAAGIRPHHLFSQIEGLNFDSKGRVLVDEFLQPRGFSNIFVIGDGAATVYAGMAQTAIGDGHFVAKVIRARRLGKSALPYQSQKPAYAIPVGPRWAAVLWHSRRFYGRFGWWLRRLADLRFFMSILPWKKALLAFQTGKTLCESCAICAPD